VNKSDRKKAMMQKIIANLAEDLCSIVEEEVEEDEMKDNSKRTRNEQEDDEVEEACDFST